MMADGWVSGSVCIPDNDTPHVVVMKLPPRIGFELMQLLVVNCCQTAYLARQTDVSALICSTFGVNARATLDRLRNKMHQSCLRVRLEGACHLWRKIPSRELSIDLEADERFGRVTGRAEAS